MSDLFEKLATSLDVGPVTKGGATATAATTLNVL